MKTTRRDFFGIGAALAAVGVGFGKTQPIQNDLLRGAPRQFIPLLDERIVWWSWPVETGDLVMAHAWVPMANERPATIIISGIEATGKMGERKWTVPGSPFACEPEKPPKQRIVTLPVNGLRGPVTMRMASAGQVIGLGETACSTPLFDDPLRLEKNGPFPPLEMFRAGGVFYYSLRREKPV